MHAYIIAQILIEDEEGYQGYRRDVAASLQPFGGRFLVRGGAIDVLEGEWPLPRLVIIEFDSRDIARQWYQSEHYQRLASVRRQAATSHLVIVDGIPDGMDKMPSP